MTSSPTLRLFTSNRLEILADALAEVLTKPLPSPLDEEIILVQSQGMERWVSTELAQRCGICANIRFPFPNAFIYEVFRKVLEGIPEQLPCDPKTMTWKIMKHLPSCLREPNFESLEHYLGDGKESLKRFQLSERIADTFDQYLLFRPKMILAWERKSVDHWQAVLWRKLVEDNGAMHRAEIGRASFESIQKSWVAPRNFPQRVCLFGISALPRFHMEVLVAISRFTQVNLFLMNPCREYWGDILAGWEMKKVMDREALQGLVDEYLHLEKGNSLLASMGRLGREFFDLVADFNCEEKALFHEPAEDNLLSCLQSDIVNLRDRTNEAGSKKVILEGDMSIQIHSCHSPMRELEVLHDQLLDMFEKDASLLPKDVLVMAPDIETYAPYIEAVFGVPADDVMRFPFSIADRSMRKEGRIVNTFLAILDLHGSRFGASKVLSVLESPPVQRKFGLTEADLELCRRWVRDTRIRWGIDEENRRQSGLPSFPENTWKAGLERLLLGYAMGGEGERMFSGVLPYDGIEGSEASVMGALLEFALTLFAHVTALGERRTLHMWSKTLAELLERFFSSDDDAEHEMQLVRLALKDLGNVEETADFDEQIDISVIQWHLRQCFEKSGFGIGFISGGITFCAMLPMRSIPFKVICLLGMNGDAYPRQSTPLSFDLMAKHPEPGDRSRRHDDRYLFLETILSARERLYISYVGRSIQDNSPIPPSVLVSELMDYIEEGLELSGKRISEQIVTKHHLQAFNPAYFKQDDKLFSYSEMNCQAAQRLLKPQEAPVPFISVGLSDPDESWKRVNLNDLCTFFRNPPKYLLNRRLGMYLEEEGLLLEEEAFELNALEAYALGKILVERAFSGRGLRDFFPFVKASGQLPHGTVGECVYERLGQGVRSFVRRTEPYVRDAALEPLEVDLDLSGFRVTGSIDGIYPDRLMQYRYARVRAKDRFTLWIRHLALNCLKPHHYPRTSMLAGLEPKGRNSEWAAWEYLPVERSEEILIHLLEIYSEGLVRPIHFFPEACWTYAEMLMKKGTGGAALRRARNVWTGSDYARGESKDVYYQLCFDNTDPLDSEFQRLSEEVFGALLAHQLPIHGLLRREKFL